MAIKSLDLVSLDFAVNKADLIAFLATSPIFKDYNFEGSNLNLEADLLAYNTNKHAFLTNMLLSEAFLDSAQLQSSVFSHAKDLNYIPRSPRSAKANIDVSFPATGVSQPYVIQKGSSFATLIKNQSYIFSIPETISISSANNIFTFNTDIYEGMYMKDSYTYSPTATNPYPSFMITNKNVDTTSLTVAVYEDNSNIPTSYQLSSTLLGLTSLSQVYFIQASENGYYEVIFGDGIIGKTPKQNSLIVLDYRVTNATIPNGASSFVINFDPTNPYEELTGTPLVTTIATASGGADAESLESVRYYAPRTFQTQERCIVPSDYETLLKTNFPEINVVSVYGGEQARPPRYGYVVVSVDLPGFTSLPITKQNTYKTFLRTRNSIPIDIIFIDPEHTYLRVNSIVRYNTNVTTNTRTYIESLVSTTIAKYNITNLNDFNAILRFSQLSTAIDKSDPSIISNLSDISIYKKLTPAVGIASNISLNFNTALVNDVAMLGSSHNAIDRTCLTSTLFIFQGEYTSLEDDGNGVIHIVKTDNNQTNVIDTIGTIDYDTGAIVLNNITFDSYDGAYFKIYVLPRDRDVFTTQNTILSIEPDEVHINVQPLGI